MVTTAEARSLAGQDPLDRAGEDARKILPGLKLGISNHDSTYFCRPPQEKGGMDAELHWTSW